MTTVITGDVDEKETINLVSKYMQSKATTNNNRKFENLKPINETVRQDIVSDKTPTAFISIGLKGPENNNVKDKIIFKAVNYLLTNSTLSRINKSLEEIQTEANSDIERLSSKLTDNTALLITAEVDDKNSENALEKIKTALDSVAQNPPTQEEIEIIKKNLKFDFSQRFENSADINSIIGASMLDGGLDYITDYENIINSFSIFKYLI